MTSYAALLDGILSWNVPPDVDCLLTIQNETEPARLHVRFRPKGRPTPVVSFTFDRPMSARTARERLDRAVAELRWIVEVYNHERQSA